MGRLIDIDILFDYFGNDAIDETTRSNIEYFVSEKGTVEAVPKADYEARLKTDMVAMLTEIQTEILELKSYESADGQDLVMLADIGILFQQKINSLKEGKDGTN